jgi:hypothetical protein
MSVWTFVRQCVQMKARRFKRFGGKVVPLEGLFHLSSFSAALLCRASLLGCVFRCYAVNNTLLLLSLVSYLLDGFALYWLQLNRACGRLVETAR